MAQVKFLEERCKGCGLCMTVCPKHLITISERINRSGYTVAEVRDMTDCTACALCAEMRPDVVISVFK